MRIIYLQAFTNCPGVRRQGYAANFVAITIASRTPCFPANEVPIEQFRSPKKLGQYGVFQSFHKLKNFPSSHLSYFHVQQASFGPEQQISIRLSETHLEDLL